MHQTFAYAQGPWLQHHSTLFLEENTPAKSTLFATSTWQEKHFTYDHQVHPEIWFRSGSSRNLVESSVSRVYPVAKLHSPSAQSMNYTGTIEFGLVLVHLVLVNVMELSEHQRLQRSRCLLLLQSDYFLSTVAQSETCLSPLLQISYGRFLQFADNSGN